MLLPSSFPLVKQSSPRSQLYRRFLQHIRLLPDPQIWSVLIPQYRNLLKQSCCGQEFEKTQITIPSSESSKHALDRVKRWKREKLLRRTEDELQRLRAAVACHPHALIRLIEECYGQRGVVRRKLLQSISSLYSIVPYINSLPPPLHPLKPPPAAPSEAQPRARKVMPPCRIRAEIRRSIQRDWAMIKAPISVPSAPPTSQPLDQDKLTGSTAWEDRAKIANLHLLSSLDEPFSTNTQYLSNLDLSSLQPHIQRIFPRKKPPKLREPPLSPPRPKATRQNPNIWGLPRRLDSRLISRTYRRFWDELVWVRPMTKDNEDDVWKKCPFEELKEWQEGKTSNQVSQITTGKKVNRKRSSNILEAGKIDSKKWSEANDQDKKWLLTGNGE